MHAAQHDAVNGAEPRYETYTSPLADRKADAEAAAAAAAHSVLVFFFPTNQAALDVELSASLAKVPNGPAERAGVALGRAVGQRLLDSRANDGFDVADPFAPTPGLGSERDLVGHMRRSIGAINPRRYFRACQRVSTRPKWCENSKKNSWNAHPSPEQY